MPIPIHTTQTQTTTPLIVFCRFMRLFLNIGSNHASQSLTIHIWAPILSVENHLMRGLIFDDPWNVIFLLLIIRCKNHKSKLLHY